MSRSVRVGLKIVASLAALLLISAVSAVLVLRTEWFHEKVKQRIISELERATGGTATLGNFAFNWRVLTFQFQDLTLHGTEPANVPPLLQAKSIEVGLKIVSLWTREVDLASIVAGEPKVNLIVAADGSTNIPEPKIPRKPGKAGLEPILDWKISRFALENGSMLFAGKKTGLNAKGENLRALFSYDFTGPRYKGQVSIQPLEINARQMAPVNMDVYLTLGLEKSRIDVTKAKFDMRRSYLEASGAIADLAAPKGAFRFTAHVAVDLAAQLLRIPMARQGTMDLAGSANYNSASDYTVLASVNGRNLELRQDGIEVSGVHLMSTARLNSRGLELSAVAINALGGRFIGRADFPQLQRFVIDGAAQNIPIQEALGTLAPQLPAKQRTTWSGVASGPIHLAGGLTGKSIVLAAQIGIAPAPGGIPVQGSIDAKYDDASGMLSLGKSHLSTPGAQVDVSGVLGQQLEVKLDSTNLQDLLPAINALSSQPVDALPIQLKNGKATFSGAVSGKLSSPLVTGSLEVSNFTYAGIGIDRFAGQVALNQSSAQLQKATLARGGAQAQISGTVGLMDWKPEPASPISGAVTLRDAEVSELLDLAGQKQIPVSGALAASARVSGTIGNPHASADFTVAKGAADGEPFDRLQASVDYSPQTIKVSQAKLIAGPAQITASASFEPQQSSGGAPDFRNGRIQFQLASNEIAIERLQIIKRMRPDLNGMAQANVEGAATIHLGSAALTALNGNLAAHDLRLDNRSIGNLKAVARTEASVLKVQLDSNFLNSNLVASGQWRLIPGYPGEANAHFSEVSLGTVRAWLTKPGEQGGLNFDGSAEGKIAIAGPALEPADWKASVELSKLEVHPLVQGQQPEAAKRFTLRNQGAVVVTLANSVIRVSSAHFAGTSTDASITGTVLLKPKTSLDLRVNGDVNLAALQNFVPDIETAGAVTVNASIRGAPDQPIVNGQLDVKRGSLHFSDITAGLSGANGTILFSGTQATIQNLTGAVGGGRVAVSGVVGYGGNQLSYRVDATAKDIRVRYPEGVSTSANAELSLRGTSQRSTLSGTVTVLRTGFTPRTDFSSILGKASTPIPTPSARSGPLSGIHFDIRIETAPDISFESAFAQDIQAEGSLRLQGTPYNPILLGRLNITQGEINFFGTKFTVDQGSITFANPVKLEPVLNVDLETRVQGVDITLTVSGPINKLNLTPRSDPPMAYADVLALLATGAAPASDPTFAARQNTPAQSFTQSGASALIGQVVANPVSGRLQRFFGVSKLKIDPQLTGAENNPQARLTLEQQVNKNITLTVITNLATNNQQIVRVEWALNNSWSVIVRDEAGLLGMDFLYKKRFK
jgi:translocation and assembly module TamB